MTAETILIKRGHTDNIKEEAVKIARLYEGNVKIQVDVDQQSNSAVVQITEYGM